MAKCFKIPRLIQYTSTSRYNVSLKYLPTMRHRGATIDVDPEIEIPKAAYGPRIYVLAVIASMGALMFGYDLGFIGTAIELSSFQRSVVVHLSPLPCCSTDKSSSF